MTLAYKDALTSDCSNNFLENEHVVKIFFILAFCGLRFYKHKWSFAGEMLVIYEAAPVEQEGADEQVGARAASTVFAQDLHGWRLTISVK